jgi:ankyrin repeat protein
MTGHHASCSGVCCILLLLVSSGRLSAQSAIATLASAAERGDLSTVSQLISNHANIDSTDDVGATALDWACRRNDVNLVRLLLAAGANPNPELKQPIVALPPGSPRRLGNGQENSSDSCSGVDFLRPKPKT